MQTKTTPIAFSGNIPKFYDDYLGPMFFEPYALAVADRVSHYANSNILELACGTGRLTKLLPTVAPSSTIVASDINPAMITYAKKNINAENITWQEIDAINLPFTASVFDIVVAQFGVMFYSNKVQAFEEAWRVLKPGGIFIFTCWDKISYNPMANIANEALKKFFPVDTPAFYSVPFSYFNENEILNDLRKANFQSISIKASSLTGSSPSAKHAAQGLIQGTPTVTAIEERDAEKLPVIIDYVIEEIERTFGTTKSITVPLSAKIVIAMK